MTTTVNCNALEHYGLNDFGYNNRGKDLWRSMYNISSGHGKGSHDLFISHMDVHNQLARFNIKDVILFSNLNSII